MTNKDILEKDSKAKGLGAGLPIGAVLMDRRTENVFQPGNHGSTFGGNPKCVQHGLLILTAKEKLRIMPPLNISREEIETGVAILESCLMGT